MLRSTRNQIVLFLCLATLTVLVGYYYFWKSNTKQNNAFIEELKSQKEVLLEKTLDIKSKNLHDFTYDYTYWDDMVNFILEKDLQWGIENIEASMPTFGVDYIWIYNKDLSLFHSYYLSGRDSSIAIPFGKETLSKIVAEKRIQHFFITIGQELIEISMASVHPTYDKQRVTPPHGYFIAGRIWDQSYLNEIGQFTESKIAVSLPTNGIINDAYRPKKFQFLSKKSLTGWNNEPVAQIESVFDYSVASKLSFESNKHIIIGAFTILFLLIVFVAFFLIKIYRPLGTLSKSLADENPSIIKKLSTSKNEFGRLSRLINDFYIQKNKLLKEIEERNQVETLLIKLSQAIEQSPATIIITGVDGTIEYVNPKFTSVTGYKLDEVIGKNPRFLKSGKKSKAEYKQMWETIHRGQVWRGEFCNRKKNGEIYFESVIISPIFDEKGQTTNYMAINEDITEKKQEETVRNIIFEIAKAGAISLTLEQLIEEIRVNLSQIIDVSNFYIAFYNEATDSFSLPLYRDQKDDIVHFKAEKTLTAFVLRSKKSFLGTYREIDELKKKGLVESIGESAKVWLGVPLIVDDKAIGVFSVQSYTDENAFDQKDQEMLEFVANEISHTVQRMKAEKETITALERAEQSDRLKSAFLANISHEIRTPLNSILGFTKLMTDPEIDSVKKHRFARIIKSNGDQLLSIINGLLDFSLIETGQVKLLRKKFIAEKVIQEIVNEYIQAAAEKEIEFVFDPTIALNQTSIESDYSRFKQAVTNLIDNAVKFTITGKIEISMEINNDNIQIAVSDTGIGIPPDFQKEVFNRFQQADKTNARKYGGNGLGLAISKHFIELMGGKIWFESELGKGSTFYIQLPIIMPETPNQLK